MKPLSKDWTAEDRLRVVAAMLGGIMDDIHAGTYGRIGRPNITAVQHIISESAATLEAYRMECETFVAKHHKEYPELDKGLWETEG